VVIEQLTDEDNQVELLWRTCSEALSREQKPVILFGAGVLGQYYLEFIRQLDQVKEVYFCDNHPEKWGTKINGVEVISFDRLLADFRDSYIIVSTLQYREQLEKQLREHGLSSLLDPQIHQILTDKLSLYLTFKNYRNVIETHRVSFEEVYRLLDDEFSKRLLIERLNYCITLNTKYLTPMMSKTAKYFDPDIIRLSDHEVFIDGGGLNGDTVDEFIRQTNGKFSKVYTFEPETTKHRHFERYASFPNIQLMPYGLYSRSGTLRFQANNDGTSSIDPDGAAEIQVVAIDEVLQGEPVTFIKMDIEGAELEALKGAENSIRQYKPKLAICVYHKPLDIVEIPLYLKQIVPDYKLYLRHYLFGASETVCYAVPAN